MRVYKQLINRFSHSSLQECHILPYCLPRVLWFWACQWRGLHCWKMKILLYRLPWLQTPGIQQLNFWTAHLARTRTNRNTDEPELFLVASGSSPGVLSIWHPRRSTELNCWNCQQEWGPAVLFSVLIIFVAWGWWGRYCSYQGTEWKTVV